MQSKIAAFGCGGSEMMNTSALLAYVKGLECNFNASVYISNAALLSPADLASECLKIMAEKKIGCLAVMQEERLAGIINQKDLVKLGIQ